MFCFATAAELSAGLRRSDARRRCALAGVSGQVAPALVDARGLGCSGSESDPGARACGGWRSQFRVPGKHGGDLSRFGQGAVVHRFRRGPRHFLGPGGTGQPGDQAVSQQPWYSSRPIPPPTRSCRRCVCRPSGQQRSMRRCAAMPTSASDWNSCAGTSPDPHWPMNAYRSTPPCRWCSNSRPPGAPGHRPGRWRAEILSRRHEGTPGAGEGLSMAWVEPGEGPRSARVCPMSRQFSGQAAGLRLPSMRFAGPMLPQNSPVCHPVRASPSRLAQKHVV